MSRRRVLVLLGCLLWPAAAQARPGGVDLETRVRRQRPVVRPPVDVDRAVRDVEAATPGAPALAGPTAPSGRRPDLGEEVWQGVQQRHLLDAIRRR
ncbi:MAG TPA: hypothetical protein VNK50_09695 [Calidithermus sp.]|nr:hypothetical protein [Calidithermus sp.]